MKKLIAYAQEPDIKMCCQRKRWLQSKYIKVVGYKRGAQLPIETLLDLPLLGQHIGSKETIETL
jgi:hypothetical protein